MIISHKYKFIFIAVPKTGSQTVKKLFRSFLEENNEQHICYVKRLQEISKGYFLEPHRISYENKPMIKENHNTVCERIAFFEHQTAQQIKNIIGDDIFNDYFKFVFVRDPIDRLISTYYFFNKNQLFFQQPTPNTLYDFYTKNNNRIHLSPQYKFVYGDNGELLVDYVGYTHKMNECLEYICKKLNISMFNNVPKLNKTTNKMVYIDNYVDNNEIKKLVYNLYFKDYEKLDFTK
jgi:hypothetical protein